MRYRTIIRDAIVSLVAALASVAGVGVLSATTADLRPVDRCEATHAERVAACECRARTLPKTDEPNANAPRDSCARAPRVMESDLRSPSPVASEQGVDPATGEHRALLLTVLFVAARIAKRRLRLYRADGTAA